MTHSIEVTVSPSGATTVRTQGYTGSDCQEASRFIEQALGSVIADHKTSEFYQSMPMQQTVQE